MIAKPSLVPTTLGEDPDAGSRRVLGMPKTLHRVGLVLLLTVAMLAGFAGRSVMVRPASQSGSVGEAASREPVDAFYGALNDVLGGGDIAQMRALLSPIFVDHDTVTGETRPADVFLADVDAASGALANIRLEVIAVEAAGGSLVVGIRTVQDETMDIAGLQARQSLPAPHVEVIRVERGVIVDRWGPDIHGLRVWDSGQSALSFASNTGIETTLMRVTLDDASERSWRTTAPGMVMVESGATILNILHETMADSPRMLGQGEMALVPAGARVRLRSADGDPVSVLVYAAMVRSAVDVGSYAGESPGSLGGVATVLWSAPAAWGPSNTVHRADLIELPPGGSLSLERPEGSGLLIGIDDGSLEIGIPGGSVATLDTDRWPAFSNGIAHLDASHAGWIQDDGSVTLRNLTDEPVVVVLIAIHPAPTAILPETHPQGLWRGAGPGFVE